MRKIALFIEMSDVSGNGFYACLACLGWIIRVSGMDNSRTKACLEWIIVVSGWIIRVRNSCRQLVIRHLRPL
jgi:hypothetical protein